MGLLQKQPNGSSGKSGAILGHPNNGKPADVTQETQETQETLETHET
jgi:hypothetical protein